MLEHCRLLRLTAAAALVLLTPAAASSADLSVRQALELLDGAMQAVTSFDVWVDSETRSLLKYERQKKDTSDKKPVVTSSRRLLPGEKPGVMHKSYRQVFQRGKGRIEFLAKDGQSVTSVVVYDDETMKAVNHDRKTAMIRELPGHIDGDGSDYLNAYRNIYGHFPLLTCLRQRRNVVLKGGDRDDASVVLETEPDPKAKIEYAPWGFRVVLERRHGLLPAVIERFEVINGKRAILRRATVDKWKSLPGGVSVPLAVTTQFFEGNPDRDTFGELAAEVRLTVDEARSSWNREIPARTFDVQIPPGFDVIDRLREVQYVTGTPDTGKNLEGLAANARNVVPYPVQRPPAAVASPWKGYVVAGGLAVGVLATIWLTLALVRRRRAGQTP